MDCHFARFAAKTLPIIALLLSSHVPASAQAPNNAGSASAMQTCPDATNGGITLPRGFCATVFADHIGHARHLVVAPNGVVYVNTWSGRYYGNDTPPPGGFLVALQDTTGDGHADVVRRFGPTAADGSHGGTGIALYDGSLYAEINDRIVRYRPPTTGIVPAAPAETIVSGLPLSGDHPMHPFIIDRAGYLYVDLGSATNSCQAQNRTLESPGISPCTELETRGGTWRYDAKKSGQRFSPAERFATGIRNGEGFAFDAAGNLYVTQHGRDQLSENWPKLYRPDQGPRLPAEELLRLEAGADYGWPACYYDGRQQKLVLAPEYGGDGKEVGVCAQKQGPVAYFPAHWAPNALAIYNADQFPTPYRGGAFIAFHGSWNRAPAPQGGYNIVFQPLADGKTTGPFVVFADGFAGAIKDPGQAAHRPSGLAIGPDGALYISDDKAGRIWRVTYQGGSAVTQVEAAPTLDAATSGNAANVLPPEGIHPDAGAEANLAAMPVPPGATVAQVALGARVFHGQVDGGTCAGCHGLNAKGTPVGPDLTSGKWAWGDGSLNAISRVIRDGVPKPKNFTSPMPANGGAQLSPADVDALAAYVWSLGHHRGPS